MSRGAVLAGAGRARAARATARIRRAAPPGRWARRRAPARACRLAPDAGPPRRRPSTARSAAGRAVVPPTGARATGRPGLGRPGWLVTAGAARRCAVRACRRPVLPGSGVGTRRPAWRLQPGQLPGERLVGVEHARGRRPGRAMPGAGGAGGCRTRRGRHRAHHGVRVGVVARVRRTGRLSGPASSSRSALRACSTPPAVRLLLQQAPQHGLERTGQPGGRGGSSTTARMVSNGSPRSNGGPPSTAV